MTANAIVRVSLTLLLVLSASPAALGEQAPWEASTFVAARGVHVNRAEDFRITCVAGPEGWALRYIAYFVDYDSPSQGADGSAVVSGEQGTGLWVRLDRTEVTLVPPGHDNRAGGVTTDLGGGDIYELRHPNDPATVTVVAASWGGTLTCTLVANGQPVPVADEPAEHAVYLNNESMPGGSGARAARLGIALDRRYERATRGFLFTTLHTFNGEVRLTDPNGARRVGGSFAIAMEETDGTWTYECVWSADAVIGLQLFILELMES